jgi:hypothetical protein
MVRRTFFHLLAGIPLPGVRWHQGFSPKSADPAPKPVPFPSSNDTPDPEWLQEWLRLPRLPVVSADLPQIADPQERDLAALILQQIRTRITLYASHCWRDHHPVIRNIAMTPESSDPLILSASALARRGIDL